MKRNLVMLMMGCVYYKDETGSAKNVVPVYIDTLVKASGQVNITETHQISSREHFVTIYITDLYLYSRLGRHSNRPNRFRHSC